MSGAQVYLADRQQRHLSPLEDADSRNPDVLLIDSTLAGRAYQTVTVHPGRADGAPQLWIRLRDDATAILVEWKPNRTARSLTP